MRIPDAQAAAEKEWGKQKNIPDASMEAYENQKQN